MVALLRGINVGGNRKVPMPELRSVAASIGLSNIETYINSGNLIFNAGKINAAQVAVKLEKAIQKHFGFSVDVIIRTAEQWTIYSSGCPFSNAAKVRPNMLMLGFSKLPVANNATELLSERAAKNERIKIIDDAIWVDFANGVAKSKLTPAFFDKAVGSPVTLRNWKTVLNLETMVAKAQGH
jgi:uncharacterized protein (DUF1697 family)